MKRFLVSLACGLAAAGAVLAQGAYPSKPVQIVVAYTAGGPADAGTRIVATALGKLLKQPFLVDNRPGASGRIGADYGARVKPDGYVITLGNADMFALNPHVYPTQTTNMLTAFEPVAQIGRLPLVVTMRSNLAADGAGLLKLAKENPGRLSYGTWGVGSLAHVGGVMMEQIGGIELLHVPFQGGAPAQVQLLAGQIDMAFTGVPFGMQEEKVGAAKVLGLTSARRSTLYPTIPTLSEQGFAGFSAEQWYGLFVPRGTPAAVTALLEKSVLEVLRDPAVVQQLQDAGFEPAAGTARELAATVKTDNARWGKVVKERNIVARHGDAAPARMAGMQICDRDSGNPVLNAGSGYGKLACTKTGMADFSVSEKS